MLFAILNLRHFSTIKAIRASAYVLYITPIETAASVIYTEFVLNYIMYCLIPDMGQLLLRQSRRLEHVLYLGTYVHKHHTTHTHTTICIREW